MCPLVITAMWLCVSNVLVYNNKCVEQTILVQTYTKYNAAKISCSGGVWHQGFRISQLAVRAFTYAPLRWRGSLSAEVNENINLGYSQDQGYS